MLQEDDEDEISDATTDVSPVGEIPETIQESAVLTQADSNKVPANIQVEIAEPEVEGGNAPRVDDPQPDGVASSLEADFIKAESEQDLPSIRRPMIQMKTWKGSSGYQILPKWRSQWHLWTQRISIPMTGWSVTLAKLLQVSPRRLGNPNVDPMRHMHPNMLSSEAREAHWQTKEQMAACLATMPTSSSSAARQWTSQVSTTMNLIHFRWSMQPAKTITDKGPVILAVFFGTTHVMVSNKHCIRLDRLNGFRMKHATPL